AAELNISLDDYYKILQDSSSSRMFGFEELGVDEEALESNSISGTPSPYDAMKDERFKVKLTEAIGGLPEREKMVVTLYYDSELNLREIGSVLGVSESRISQLLSQAMIRLRARMKEWLAD
ncbi:MAG: sigma-70 family RNA polymerase sigma factor, partial [Gammaproteobacteria bacterium]|nr:sigma-70 family RNA polymerase sigma factor [Gammaproteobacteria bacterium]